MQPMSAYTGRPSNKPSFNGVAARPITGNWIQNDSGNIDFSLCVELQEKFDLISVQLRWSASNV